MRRRGITLIEAVVCVLLLAVAVPPAVEAFRSAGDHRHDSVSTTRAVMLATTVLETVIADNASTHEELGFAAFEDPESYLNDPVTGLYARLVGHTEPHTRAGLSYTVEIGPPVSSDAQPSEDAHENVLRTVTVRVALPTAAGPERVMPVSVMVGNLR